MKTTQQQADSAKPSLEQLLNSRPENVRAGAGGGWS